jgi:DNA repair protein RadC
MKQYNTHYLPIAALAEDEKPREKLIKLGARALSDTEIVALLLGSGTIETNALDLARQVLSTHQNNLNIFAKSSLKELTKIKGIGTAKATTLLAAFELGKRRAEESAMALPIVRTSQNAYEYIKHDLMDLHHEEFWLLLLNRGNKITHKIQISRGSMTGTFADAKIIFQKALENKATSIILVHNHPSGASEPSEADKNLTKKLVQAAGLLDLLILDHLIITTHHYFSFADAGIL